MNIREELFALQDMTYADFQAKLTPGIARAQFIGVRVPEARKLAKRLIREPEADLSALPCVLAGSFCYLGSTLSAAERQDIARTRDYNAMIDNCIAILHHYR